MLQQSGFGGGCHWCTEAVFQGLRGVEQVDQGFIASEPPYQSFSEAALVTYNPDVITLSELIEVHLATHSSTSNHKMRVKYRSAVYLHTNAEIAEAREIIDSAMKKTDLMFVTQVLRFEAFKPSDDRYHDYYGKNRGKPFCESSIEPKLTVLRERFSDLLAVRQSK